MNTKSVDNLRISAETGNINLLYAVIPDDPSILDFIDKNQFVETPLHIAAFRGHHEFAIEIMNLKPSFATKLNLQGYSPIHLAVASLTHLDKESPTYLDEANLRRMMMASLVKINKDLVRVKGREGLTPFHFACQIGDDILARKFVYACQDSIRDVNVRGETALHIAAKNEHYRVLKLVIDEMERDADDMFYLKDIAGNTALHFSALSSEPKFLQLLVKTRIPFDEINFQHKTALDLARTPEMKNILIRAKKKRGPRLPKFFGFPSVYRITSNITEQQRNTWLIIATLVATVTYESALSPPGGLFQVSASDDNNVKIKSTYGFFSIRGNAGKSILSRDAFMVYSLANVLSFSLSIVAILFMTPHGVLRPLVLAPLSFFCLCYLIAMPAISPTYANTIILSIPMYLIFSSLFLYFFMRYIIVPWWGVLYFKYIRPL